MKEQNKSQKAELNRSKLLLFKLIVLGFSLAVGLFLCEVITRVYYFGKDAFSYTKVNSFIPLGVSGFLQGADNNEILYELKPSIDSYFKLATFKTNAQGNRDKEYSIVKPEKTIRGLVFGDSYTMGSGVEIENVYHSVVEQQLNEKSNGINYELINFGVGGYNLLNYKGLLEEKTTIYNPDFILIGFCGFNDFFLPPAQHYEGDYKVKVKKDKETPFFSCYLCGLIERTFASTTTKQMFEIKPEEKEFMDRMFLGFSEFSKDNNIPIVISVLAVLADNGNLEIIKELAEKHGLPITDSYGKIDQTMLKDYTISKLDHHPNAKANKIFANGLLHFESFKEILLNREQKLAN